MKLLVNEDLIPLLPSLAMNVGLNAALFLQQLHDRIEELPFWPLNTIKRITYDLKQKGYLISTSKHNKMKIDNTKWYRIDYEKLPSSYKQCKIPANPIVDAASSQHEMTVTPQLDAVSTHIETGAYPTMGRPITKELKNIKNKPIVEKNLDVAHSVIQYFNDKTGKQFKPKSAATRKFINGRIKEGYTQEDFIRVIDLKTKQWLNCHEFSAFLRCSTVFNATNFENYVYELFTSTKPKRRPLEYVLSIFFHATRR